MLLQNRNTVVQLALIGKCHQLLQVFSVSQFYVQPQEGAVHLLNALQALLTLPDCPEKISQEAQVMMKCVSVLLPEHLEISALVPPIKLGLKALAETRLHVGVETDDFSGVQLTFAVQVGKEYRFVLGLGAFRRKEPLFTKFTYYCTVAVIYLVCLELAVSCKGFYSHMNRSLASEKPCW